jgi:hypothetical protein
MFVRGFRRTCCLHPLERYYFRVCTTAVRLSVLVMPFNAVDSDHSTGNTYRGRFPGAVKLTILPISAEERSYTVDPYKPSWQEQG